MKRLIIIILAVSLFPIALASARTPVSASSIQTQEALASPSQQSSDNGRILSGYILTQQNDLLPGVNVIARSASVELRTMSDAEGRFRLAVPREPLTLSFEGNGVTAMEKHLGASDQTENLQIKLTVIIPLIKESVVIHDTSLNPAINQRNDVVYKNTLFQRDDQLVFTLNAGINAGQHEGGGKSLEIRRFGFNLDHGGINGGLKVLVDNVQQNQGTQGHGQGYLGQLKSLMPELIDDVEILNGPFSAQYGDFSGLGVVQIRLKESLAEQLTFRVQGGSFNSRRAFFAYNPELKHGDFFIAYESSYTDGPFQNPGRYRRDNFTGNYTRRLSESRTIGFKLNAGRNNFFSSGQIPLDQVAAGRLDRFGFIDSDNGGRVRTGFISAYFKEELERGGSFKVDGFLGRSLFDLFSNFTFFLNDPLFGDEIDQHDSRLQQGMNVQLLHPHRLFGRQALLTVGGNFLANQINVGLLPSFGRNPNRLELNRALGIDNPGVLLTRAHARVTNVAGYVQQGVDFFNGRLHFEGGLRYDYFHFRVSDGVNEMPTEVRLFAGIESAARFQPKASASYTISDRVPLTFYLNYGRGINSQDARGVVQRPDSPRIATTDFYQVSAAYNKPRYSLSADYFLIDHSNEAVYIPDDGSFEFKGPSRSTGYELKVSAGPTRHLTFSAGLTQVMNAFYRGTHPRLYVDSAPRTVANGSLTYSAFRGFFGTLSYRHVSNYRLDGEDARVRASGLDVLDLNLKQRLRRWLDFNLSIENLTDKRYYETQNYFESRLRPSDSVISRTHGTPGYSRGITAGLTFRLFGK